jgi:hypothetical protein
MINRAAPQRYFHLGTPGPFQEMQRPLICGVFNTNMYESPGLQLPLSAFIYRNLDGNYPDGNFLQIAREWPFLMPRLSFIY